MEELKVDYGTTQYIVIKMGDEQYGIDIQFINNIVRMQSFTRVPNVQSYIKGVINLRGEVVPVMSLRNKMDMEEEEYTKATRIIILKVEQHETVGIIVDEVKEVVTLDAEDIDKVSYEKDEKAAFLTGVGKHDGQLISLLDLNAVLSDM